MKREKKEEHFTPQQIQFFCSFIFMQFKVNYLFILGAFVSLNNLVRKT